ncbi:putative cytochrome P450 superfamily protein isoform X4 [Iris pallida]|uniref:Cytochrome P450 superfamily protein isoform X4 n=1 Tax=Iris pallida TaxID=29817 RepID=A0AAX6GIC3_IRIPA|nr:putative cytochrome P450 superfamily protein isoform X4 [Iris pallida]
MADRSGSRRRTRRSGFNSRRIGRPALVLACRGRRLRRWHADAAEQRSQRLSREEERTEAGGTRRRRLIEVSGAWVSVVILGGNVGILSWLAPTREAGGRWWLRCRL